MINNKTHKFDTHKIEYQPDLAVTLFRPIADHPWSMLLRSPSTTHPDSRFDILVANPIATLVSRKHQTYFHKGDSVTVSQADPFELLQHHLDNLLPRYTSNDDLPFVGGALGYFSYDLGRRVEQLPELAENDIDIPEMAVGFYRWAVIVDHHKKQAHVVGQDVQNAYQYLLSRKETDTHTETELRQTEPSTPFSLSSQWQSNMSAADYRGKFNKIQGYLLSGDCYQINLAQRFKANYSGSEFDAYLMLENQNRAPFSAFLKLEESAIISISPERFIQLSAQSIQTKPIKGTLPRSQCQQQDIINAEKLARSEKDQAENLMIVDLLRNDIGRVALPGSVSVPKLFDVESFPAVHHLVSTITAKLDKQYQPTDLLRACFPGGSITGAPKVRAMEIIEELEPHRRTVYCGSIGYISQCGTMDTSITIRTLVAHNNTLYAWAGGGIVADSQCDAEYQETLDKLSRILPVLEKAEHE
ncbi:aminodeoxychorismate synthase component 1 [Vibrio sp. 99-8-1]|uniref:aminodeoxychorismate synthase component 1 n=1 Tax=Vibrio sp. 99-8-1 TaxID=2607602 RepID=UPI001493AAD0|nr:aminodeoxychorismate synthase component 1 [Vibrio sp. 99-8-1]NOI65521.1 aminodeoxychorismate synthase component 1 [Vibrio sp. 99-8-1]